jgi:hypothetical protein
MIRRDLRTDGDEPVFADAEFRDSALGLDLRHGKVATLGLRQRLRPAGAGAELKRDVAVLVLGAVSHDLAVVQSKHRDRHMIPGLRKDPHHAHLLCDHAGAHRTIPFFGSLRA